jgi:hypothetical protein
MGPMQAVTRQPLSSKDACSRLGSIQKSVLMLTDPHLPTNMSIYSDAAVWDLTAAFEAPTTVAMKRTPSYYADTSPTPPP